MAIDIKALDRSLIERRGNADIIDYPFEVSIGKEVCIVKVGITGAHHDPAEALGLTKLSQPELIQAASEWLHSRIEKMECDPFKRPQADRVITMPSEIVEYWAHHGEIPSWL